MCIRDSRRTVQNLEVARVDAEQGLVLIKGATPGAKGAWIEIRDAVKGAKVSDLPLPGKFTTGPAPKAEKKDTAPSADFVDAIVLVDVSVLRVRKLLLPPELQS